MEYTGCFVHEDRFIQVKERLLVKTFNTTAVCIPSKHYMVDLSKRVEEIKRLVDAGKYFTINRARQYGKTTTLSLLENRLSSDYYVVSMDFQDYGEDSFRTEDSFCRDFSSDFCSILTEKISKDNNRITEEISELRSISEEQDKPLRLFTMFKSIKRIWDIADKPIVLFVDEVDSATNNQLFIDFLSSLRSHYLKREKKPDYKTFQSVILAGVTDVKHLKSKIRDEGEHKVNSPWNIAADFEIDMSLSEEGIQGMLEDYEADHHTGMDTTSVAKSIRAFTNGYPYLVSRICELIDKEVCRQMSLSDAWTIRGVDEAVKLILAENNTLFQSLTEKLTNYPELKASIRSILMEGTRLTYNPDQEDISQMEMYGLIQNDHNTVKVANRIFETRLYNLFLSDEKLKKNVFSREGELAKNMFVEDGKLNMRLILDRFIVTYTQICGPLQERFKEKDGREHFLLYLKPIINGTGNYYIEAQTRDQTRTDVIVDYLGQQYIIELKIWHGERYNEKGEKQISEYLNYWNLDTGYMLSFNFNKNKKQGVDIVHVGNKTLYEGTV